MMINTAQNRQNAWIRRPRLRPEARLRLFCFPYAGGGASIYYEWGSQLPESVELCALQLPGRENRLREAPFDELTLLVQVLLPIILPYLDRPFVLFGHSMGSLLAYELARALKRQWGMEPLHLLVSGRRAPHWPSNDPPIHGLPDTEFLQTVRQRYGGIPDMVWQNAELMQLVLPALRADFTLIERYVPSSTTTSRLTCPITAFGGTNDHLTNHANLSAWKEVTDGLFDLQMLPGKHFFIKEPNSGFLERVKTILLDSLRAIVI